MFLVIGVTRDWEAKQHRSVFSQDMHILKNSSFIVVYLQATCETRNDTTKPLSV